MMKLACVHICEHAELEKGKLSIHGVFDRINAPGFPAVYPEMGVVIHVDATPGRHHEYASIRKDGREIARTPVQEFAPTTEKPRNQFIHRLIDFKLPSAGRYDVEAVVDGNIVGTSYFFARVG